MSARSYPTWMTAEVIAKPIAARYGRPVTMSPIPPQTVDATPSQANAMSRSSTCLTMAFQVACNAPAPMTIATTSGVSCAWVVTPVFCLLVPVRAAGKTTAPPANYCAAGKNCCGPAAACRSR